MSGKLNVADLGRELAEDIEIPIVSTLPSRATETVAGPEAVGPRPASRRAVDPMAALGEAYSETLVPLNVRIRPWVHKALHERLLDMKRKRKITKEEVVESAIIQLLNLAEPG